MHHRRPQPHKSFFLPFIPDAKYPWCSNNISHIFPCALHLMDEHLCFSFSLYIITYYSHLSWILWKIKHILCFFFMIYNNFLHGKCLVYFINQLSWFMQQCHSWPPCFSLNLSVCSSFCVMFGACLWGFVRCWTSVHKTTWQLLTCAATMFSLMCSDTVDRWLAKLFTFFCLSHTSSAPFTLFFPNLATLLTWFSMAISFLINLVSTAL